MLMNFFNALITDFQTLAFSGFVAKDTCSSMSLIMMSVELEGHFKDHG
jgi:hypothetical protein